jgi:nucleotide-binding universal stress UspA family protein
MTTWRILVSLDGSAAAEPALPETERIAFGGAEAHLLHVVPSLPLTLGALPVGVTKLHDQALSYLEAVRGRFPETTGLDLIRTDEPGDANLRVALESNVDPIAMSTHARSGRERAAFESVAQAVLARADRAVLLQKPVLHAIAPRAWRGQ